MFTKQEGNMPNQNRDDGSKRVKNIAAVLYLLVMIFVVGGSYINQQQDRLESVQVSNRTQPAQ